MVKKVILLLLISLNVWVLSYSVGLTPSQALVLSIFSISILGTLFFWDFRLSFVFIGSGIFLLMGAVDLETFIKFASLDVILFLISMMIIVGMMKEEGFFHWLITLLLRIKNLTGRKLFLIIVFTSALFSALMDEVTSTIIMVTVIINICNFLEVTPLPLVISSIMATNIGSAATVLGNPVGVLIAARSKLSFEDFLTHSLPLSVFILIITALILVFWFRDYIRSITPKLKEYQDDQSFQYLISVPPDIRTKVSMLIFGVTIACIALHKRIEVFCGIEENTMLIMIPVISAGFVMMYRHDKARHYVEHEVEWNSLLFFLFLFAQAGVIQATGIANFLAQKLVLHIGDQPRVLAGVVLFSSALLSSGLDNVVAVASYIPVVQSLDAMHFDVGHIWWALLFGACYGGNITMIGSTANIVSLSLLEKEADIKVNFLEWLKIGLCVGIFSLLISYFALIFLPIFS